MQILSAEQIRDWDRFTIQHEPIASIDLMERAARQCVQWLIEKQWTGKRYLIFCGKGNNGGDGLAIARLLLREGYAVGIYILEFGKLGSDDFQTNLQRLHELPHTDIHFIHSLDGFPVIDTNDIVIDALYGSGLNKPLEGLSAGLVHHLNNSGAPIVSIDLPSGLFINQTSQGNAVVKATYSLTFQCYKMGLLVQENAPFVGYVHVLDIGLHQAYLNDTVASFLFTEEAIVRKIFKPRQRFSHKGTFGHALIIGGSYGKMGAAVLAARACAMSGAGLTTAFVPKCGYGIMQTALPEAMAMVDEEETHLRNLPDDVEKFSSIGIGPGIGTELQTQKLLSFVIRRYHKPLVIDADGLNCLSLNKEWLPLLPFHSILTPHPKEFDRLFGEHKTDFDRINTAQQKASEYNVIIVLKGHHSFVATPEGPCYFNSTGNAGMAKGGSGDVLTGLLTSLLAQGYSPADAAVFGVYLHGKAGDFAALRYAKEAMLPSHLIEHLPDVFLSLQ